MLNKKLSAFDKKKKEIIGYDHEDHTVCKTEIKQYQAGLFLCSWPPKFFKILLIITIPNFDVYNL